MRPVGCDQCERDFHDGDDVVTVHEEDGRLYVVVARVGASEVDDALILIGLRYHRDCYEVDRIKEPALPRLDRSA